MSEDQLDIYDEACSEIRHALDAYAVAIVDLSQFHLFYPTFQGSSQGGSSTRGKMSRFSGSKSGTTLMGTTIGGGSTASPSLAGGGETLDASDAYAHNSSSKRARQTYALTDPTAPSRTPQVLHIPSGRAGRAGTGDKDQNQNEVSQGVLLRFARIIAQCLAASSVRVRR